jgi:inner membrane protein
VDFITQNLLGAVAGHAAFGRPRDRGGLGRVALLAGAAGGAVPDFDFLLRRFADPAMPWELHRHFTHALWFIPIGGLLAALPFLLVPRCRRRFGLVYATTTIACATHAPLDNLTSYGTHILWPFLSGRTSWDAMSIVDPVFSGLLALAILVALIRGQPRATRVAMSLALAYVAFGFAQHGRAESAQRAIARERGHAVENARTMPTLGNVIVFRSLYEADGRIWADAIRVPLFGPPGVRAGSSRPRFTEADLPPGASDRARDVFRGLDAFADGFVAVVDPPFTAGASGLVLGDMRISMETDGFRPLWGIRMDDAGVEPTAWNAFGGPRLEGDDPFRGTIDDVFRASDRFRTLDTD